LTFLAEGAQNGKHAAERSLFSGSQYSAHQQTSGKITIFLPKKSFWFYIDFLDHYPLTFLAEGGQNGKRAAERSLFSGSQYFAHQQTSGKNTIFLPKKPFWFYINFLDHYPLSFLAGGPKQEAHHRTEPQYMAGREANNGEGRGRPPPSSPPLAFSQPLQGIRISSLASYSSRRTRFVGKPINLANDRHRWT
jgi:hypothetical protein